MLMNAISGGLAVFSPLPQDTRKVGKRGTRDYSSLRALLNTAGTRLVLDQCLSPPCRCQICVYYCLQLNIDTPVRNTDSDERTKTESASEAQRVDSYRGKSTLAIDYT